MNSKRHDIRQSSPVEEVIGRPPSSIVRWGIFVIAIVFIVAVAGAWVLRYPKVIAANINITTLNPPATIMAQISGQIREFYVTEGQEVGADEYLAVLETSADIESVDWLYRFITETHFAEEPEIEDLRSKLIPDKLILGELQSDYSSFRTSCIDYIDHLEINYSGKMIEALRSEIDGIDSYIERLDLKESRYKVKVKLSEAEFSRAKILFDSSVTSAQQFEDAQKAYNNDQIDLDNIGLEKNEKSNEKLSKMQQLVSLEATELIDIQKLRSEMEDRRVKLQGAIESWYLTHLLKSPIKGKVTLTKVWGENQSVTEGEIVMTVIPSGESKIIGKIELPMSGSGRVEEGQTVHIMLSGYPYMEFGTVMGEIESISPVANADQYLVEVGLPDGLVTNYNKELRFSQNMSGTANIITKKVSLIQRILDPMKYLIERNRLLSED